MGKRKQAADTAADGDGEDSDVSLIDVDFEFFNPNPDVDYIALKRLIVQQFQSDAEAINPTALAELILANARVGTTVKCDGEESDPYAFLTVLNMHEHRENEAIKALSAYALSKSAAKPAFHAALQSALGSTSAPSTSRVGFVFCERLINMPVQIIPPMYRMLAEEIDKAVAEKEPYSFTHLLFISRVYRLTAAEEADMLSTAAAPRTKRQKKAAAQAATNPAGSGTGGGGTFSFHPEDEHITKVATHSIDYSFAAAQPREEDAFGLDTGGRMMLIPFARFRSFVDAISAVYAPPTS